MKENIPTLKIDSDVPMPIKHMRFKGYQLEVGQSIFMAGAIKTYGNRFCVKLKKENPDHEYVARAWIGDRGVTGVRIWRTK